MEMKLKWKRLDGEFFTGFLSGDDGDMIGFRYFSSLLVGFAIVIVSFIAIILPLFPNPDDMATLLWWLWLGGSYFLALGLSYVNRLYYLYGIPKGRTRELLEEYASLSKDDQVIPVKTIINTLKDPDLEAQDQWAIEDKMDSLLNIVKLRDGERQTIDKREVDISPVLEALETGRRNAEIDYVTLKEFADKPWR